MSHSDNPTLDPRVKIGPMEQRAGVRYFLVKHSGTERIFRIGEQEQFMLNCMDGNHDAEEIGRRYEARFNKHMAPASWEQLFTLCRRRSLLVSNPPDNVPDPLPVQRRFTTSREGLFEWKVRLVNPNSMLRRIEPRIRFLFSPLLILLGLLLIIASEAWVVLHVHAIFAQLAHVGRGHWLRIAGYVGPAFIAASLIHELAHALTCRYLGGTVNDMGIIFRYLSFYPYTKLDDVMLFHNRVHRIYAFSAGMFSTLLFSVPFVLIWLLATGPYAKAASGLLIIALSLGTFINLLPFVQLDGYWIVTTFLQMPDLRQDSYIVWKSIMRRALRMQARWPSYSGRELTICLVYGLVAAVVSACITTAAIVRWHHLLAFLGNVFGWIVLGLLMTAFAVVKIRRSKTAESHHIGSRVIVE